MGWLNLITGVWPGNPKYPEHVDVAVLFDDLGSVLSPDVDYYSESEDWECIGIVPGNQITYYQFQLCTRPP